MKTDLQIHFIAQFWIMEELESKANEVFNLAVYLQMMGSFDVNTNFQEVRSIVIETHDFLTKSTDKEIAERLPEIKATLEKMTRTYLQYYPTSLDINSLATDWNELFKEGQKVFNYGLSYGWLSERMDISSLTKYDDYTPYHLKIGLVAHKGFFGIEEDFLLKDAFNVLVKAEHCYDFLIAFGAMKANEAKEKGLLNFDSNTYTQITNIKFEVSAYCRLTAISFYAFFECFVNSIGFSYLQYNKNQLDADDKDILKGTKKGRYLTLKSKIERFQKIMRSDGKSPIITSDENQSPECFRELFHYYEALRNAAVHYSPEKESIWLKPEDWIEKARNFSRLTINASLMFWKAAMEKNDGPKYLGKLDYGLLYDKAQQNMNEINKIRSGFFQPAKEIQKESGQ